MKTIAQAPNPMKNHLALEPLFIGICPLDDAAACAEGATGGAIGLTVYR